jgi:hypothetical protein
MSRAAVLTGSDSYLERMIIKLCKDENIGLIHIVKTDENVKILKEEHG